MALDILAFGPHPDDVELGIGGTIALHAEQGRKVGICDLTRGEMGTNGTPELRCREAEEAAEILGVSVRENLSLQDGFITNDKESITRVIELIRKYRPSTVLLPHPEDDHPDHGEGSRMIRQACHLAGLKKYPVSGERFRPENVFYYFLGRPKTPDLVVDITEVRQKKVKAIMAYKSQLGMIDNSLDTRLTRPDFLDRIEGRERYMGHLAGCEFGEGLIGDRPLKVNDLMNNGGKS